ncbi:proteasome 26S subunit, non-ATPase 2 [Rhinolophus ferrumequinum]|uniref:Proteasome 26S subunit, non-ATPase 2 n=1 Tax=Rhinolophus ferrumequinum TaxID=59479 RepID=A0A7J8AGL8_RHIFE|nr:proteasome 26S subunit, non-ATPase 2 [Rhinolophus ferrumequinum]
MEMSLPLSFRPSWRSRRLSSRTLMPVGFLLAWASITWGRERPLRQSWLRWRLCQSRSAVLPTHWWMCVLMQALGMY